MFNLVPEGAKRDRGPEYVFEQIIAENFPNLGRETDIQIQIERSPPNQEKPFDTSIFNSETCKFQR